MKQIYRKYKLGREIKVWSTRICGNSTSEIVKHGPIASSIRLYKDRRNSHNIFSSIEVRQKTVLTSTMRILLAATNLL